MICNIATKNQHCHLCRIHTDRGIRGNCPRMASRSTTRRFQLPSNPNFPSSSTPQRAPRGSAWSKPAISTARKPLVLLINIFFCRGCCPESTELRLHREGLSDIASSPLVFLFLLSTCFLYLSRVPSHQYKIYTSWPSSSHHSLIPRYSQMNAMRSTWASRRSWIPSLTNALST